MPHDGSTIASPAAPGSPASPETPRDQATRPARGPSTAGPPRVPAGRPAPAELPPGHAIGQYEIIRLLGRGGMGEVYLARDLRLGRLVAVKRLSTHGAESTARFLAEARTTARCMHENIVVIHEVGEQDGRPYMVLEHIEGKTLRQWMREHAAAAGEHAPVPPGRAVELMLPVVRALAYAHARGIVHRDLKPENVMLTRAGAIKVLDFGIAKLLAAPAHDEQRSAGAAAAVDASAGRMSDTGPVRSSAMLGTLPYMSPEQMNQGVLDHRSDLWTVGIMLFELVTGRHPVPTYSMGELLRIADADEPMPGVSEVMPDPGPEMGPLAGIIDRCLLKDPEHRTPSARALLAELEALAPGRRAVLVRDDDNPFAGLAAFQEADADRFFGRDRDIDQLVTELRSRPLVAVAGPSGAGKSSLVRAGVIPALKRSGEGWDAYVVRPGREPLAALAAMLDAVTGRYGPSREPGPPGHGTSGPAPGDGAAGATPGPLAERLRAEPGYLGALLRGRATSKLRRVLVFVDQLEELYTLGAPAQRAAFLACLAAVADDAASPLRVLVAMRSDFLDRLTEDRRLGAEVIRGLVLLPPMDRDGMREALLRPVIAREHRFAPPALVDRMVDALAATPGALPLLQFTAARLWERRDRDRRLLTEASHDALGGVAGALAAHADAVLAGMSPAHTSLARAVFERLVTPERTRALISVAELCALHRDPGLVDEIVQHLAAMRLVVIERGAEGAERTVELVHESLIDRWPTLVRWLDEDQDDAAMLARLRGAARDWERGGQAAGLLWTGEAADEARAWLQRYRGALAPAEQRYLDAVLATAERARRVRRRLFGALLSAAVVVALAMAWLAWEQAQAREEATALARQEAEARQAAATAAGAAAQEAARARDATRMAALRALPADPTTQLALLRELEDTRAPLPGAVQEVKRLLHAGLAPVVLVGHDDAVYGAEFSPDGRRIVSASLDRTVRVWNADGSGAPLILRGHDAAVTSVAFNPDGQRIVSASADATMRIWRADGTGAPLILHDQKGGAPSVAFSPDGQRIVSASVDGAVRVWRADGSGAPLVLRGHDVTVTSVAFSPDGQRIVSASVDGTVRVWNADGSGAPLILIGHEEVVWSAAFHPGGQRIASASWDRTVRVWNADGSGAPLVLRGHDDAVTSVAFSPDGQRIASASFDKTVRVWNADGTGEPLVLRGHAGGFMSAAFSPDGRRIVSASDDRTVRVWNLDGSNEPLILRGQASVAAAAFHPDGRRIASASVDGTVRVWNADGSGAPLVLRGHEAPVWSVAFSPDGQRIVSAGVDSTVRVWRVDGAGAPLVLRGHDTVITSVAFSPDGQRIVSSSADTTVRLWRADGTGAPLVLRGHDDWVIWVEFSPDGQRIASASRDRTLRIWRADGAGEPVLLAGHDRAVNMVRFSADGRRIVSASEDGTMRVWHDLAPPSLDDPRLWTATTYCMSIERREQLLGVSGELAGRDRQRCLARVAQAHGWPAAPPP